jgi:hypothetical protein
VTWRLHKLVLYSHDGRRHQIPDKGFREKGVSIVVGDSNTGKSAMLEIINYCLGASECEIADYIRRRCSWVGVQFVRQGQFVLLCRQIPARGRKSADAYFLKAGMTNALPAGADELRTGGGGALVQLEQMLGIGEMKLDDPATAGGFSVSVRHCAPYSLVRDDVIISKNTLVSGARDEKRGRHLRETLPYFLGHVTETAIRLREELRRGRAELRARETALEQRRSIAREGSLQLASFMDQARTLGLISGSAASDTREGQRAALARAAQFRISGSAAPPESERHALEGSIGEIRRRLLRLQDQRRAVERTARDADGFWSAASGQLARLESLDLLVDPHQGQACPVCSRDLSERAESMTTLRTAMQALQRDIGEVTYDRPRLDGYLRELDGQIDALKLDQEQAMQRVAELVRLDQKLAEERGLDEARLRLAGKIELYLESTKPDDLSAEEAEVERLRARVTALEQETAGANLDEEMSDDQVVLSTAMKEIIDKLPFAAEYRKAVPVFDWKNLQVHLRDGQRRVAMASIGSDENYLAVHLAFFLSIHKLFAARRRPVLQFIMIDQVTRPYFPDDRFAQVVQLPAAEGQDAPAAGRRLSDEAAKVRQIFDVLFKAGAAEDAPQIIICEKANAGDPAYQDAIVLFWASPEGMVPGGWPAQV